MDIPLLHPLVAGQNLVLRQKPWATPVLLQNGKPLVPASVEHTQTPTISIFHYRIEQPDGTALPLLVRPDLFEFVPIVEIDGNIHLPEPVSLTVFEHRYAQLLPLAQLPFVIATFGMEGGIFGMIGGLLGFLICWMIALKLNFVEFYKNQPIWAKYATAFFISLLACFVAVVINRVAG